MLTHYATLPTTAQSLGRKR